LLATLPRPGSLIYRDLPVLALGIACTVSREQNEQHAITLRARALCKAGINERDDFVSAIAYEQIIAPGVKRNKDINRISKQQTARYVKDDSLSLV
jgi:hypothetical protein